MPAYLVEHWRAASKQYSIAHCTALHGFSTARTPQSSTLSSCVWQLVSTAVSLTPSLLCACRCAAHHPAVQTLDEQDVKAGNTVHMIMQMRGGQ